MSRKRLIALGVAVGGWLLAAIVVFVAEWDWRSGYEWGLEVGHLRGFRDAMEGSAGA